MNGLLIDENLPRGLGVALGEPHVHASALGSRLSDDLLWERARQDGLVVVTKDADFFDRLMLDGPPPKVVWFRTGNLRRADLESYAISIWKMVRQRLQQADLIEIHSDRIEAIKF